MLEFSCYQALDILAHGRWVCVTQMSPSLTPGKCLWSLLLFSHTQAISQVSFLWSHALMREIQGLPGPERERDAARQYCSTLWLRASHDWKSHKRHSPQPQPDNKSPFPFHDSHIYPSYILQKAYTWVSCMHISENKQLIWNEKIPGLWKWKNTMDLGKYPCLKTFAVYIEGTVVRDEGLFLKKAIHSLIKE